jgi:hypothetical protein
MENRVVALRSLLRKYGCRQEEAGDGRCNREPEKPGHTCNPASDLLSFYATGR